MIDALITPTSLFLALVATTAVLAIAAEWRLNLLALLVQYLVVGVLLGRYLALQVAALKVLVGALACAILYVTARAAEQHPGGEGFVSAAARRALVWSPTINDLLFRALAVAVVGAGVLGSGLRQAGFEGGNVTLAPAVWLATLGLLFLALGRATFAAGVGLLTFQTGVEVFHAAVDQSAVVLGGLAVAHLLLAVAIAYGIGRHEAEAA